MSWKTVALGDVCTIVNGGTPKSEVLDYWDGNLNWITPKEMGKLNSREVFTTERKITENGLKNSSAKLLPVNSVILSSRAPIGHLAINKELMATNQGCKGLVPSSSLNYEYLYYFLSYSKKLLNDMGSGATFKELSGSKLATVEIPFPPLSTQQKIVAKLDAIFAEIDKATAAAEANSKNAEALFQSYLTQIFENDLSEYVERSIDEITLKTKNISPDKNPLEEFSYVDVSSVSNESFKIVSTQKILGKEAPSRAKKHILENDILFATVRPTLKRIALVPSELSNQVASTGYVVLRASKDALPKFIFYFLFSNNFMEQMNKLQKGASYPAVTDSDVKSQRLRVPPLDVQKIVTEKIDALFERCSLISKINQSRVIELAAIKKSILNKAFSGELVKE